MYGPSGETATSSIVYTVPVGQLPKGSWEYAAGIGRCPGNDCSLTSYGDLRYGASRHVTVAGGVEGTTDSVGHALHPYGAVYALLRPGTVAEVHAVAGSFARATVQNVTQRSSTTVSGGVIYPGSGQFSFLPVIGPRWHLSSSFTTSAPQAGPLRAIGLTARLEAASPGGIDRIRMSALTAVRAFHLEAGYESGVPGAPGIIFLQPASPVPRFAPAWLRAASLNGTVAFAGGNLHQAALSAGVQTGASSYASLSLQSVAGGDPPAVYLSFGRRLGFANVRTQAAGGDRLQGSWSAEGSVAYGSDAGFLPFAYRGTGMAGIGGRVFYDLDGDGIFGPADRPLALAKVRVGAVSAPTSGSGAYRVWSVLPFEVAHVAVDTLSMPDPGWVPAVREARVRPAPNIFTTVDIPLVQTRELAGRLVAGERIASAAGVTLEITAQETGSIQKTATFSDGEFYLSRLRPGAHELRVADSSLRALNARAEPARVQFTIPASGADLVVELDPMELLPAAPVPLR